MKGIFCGAIVKTNEEYKVVIKNRMKFFVAMIIIGAITSAVAIMAEFFMEVTINSHMLGVYSGMGAGLVGGGLLLLVKNSILLKSEEKLKESRLNNSDERILEISNKALRAATIAMLITMYGIGLIGGLFYPILATVLMYVVLVFILAYLLAYKYYNSKM